MIFFSTNRWDGSAGNDLALTIFNDHNKSGQSNPTYIKPDMIAPPVSEFKRRMFKKIGKLTKDIDK